MARRAAAVLGVPLCLSGLFMVFTWHRSLATTNFAKILSCAEQPLRGLLSRLPL